MREIENVRSRAPPQIGPAIADLASEGSTWAEEFLASETQVQVGLFEAYHFKMLN